MVLSIFQVRKLKLIKREVDPYGSKIGYREKIEVGKLLKDSEGE